MIMSNTYMSPEIQQKELVTGFAEDREGFIHPEKTGSLVPCAVDKSRICNYPTSCCMKKFRKIHLVKQEKVPAIIEDMIAAIEHNPLNKWNIAHWNKFIPDYVFVKGYETQTQAIRAFNVIVKMESTLAACLRDKKVVKDSYVWML